MADEYLSLGIEQLVVPVVCDFAAINDLPYHLLEGLLVDFFAGENVFFTVN